MLAHLHVANQFFFTSSSDPFALVIDNVNDCDKRAGSFGMAGEATCDTLEGLYFTVK